MMSDNDLYEAGLSSDAIDEAMMAEEATREKADALLAFTAGALLTCEDEIAIEKMFEKDWDPITAVGFEFTTSTKYFVKANNYHDNCEVHHLCDYKCGRNDGDLSWLCACKVTGDFEQPCDAEILTDPVAEMVEMVALVEEQQPCDAGDPEEQQPCDAGDPEEQQPCDAGDPEEQQTRDEEILTDPVAEMVEMVALVEETIEIESSAEQYVDRCLVAEQYFDSSCSIDNLMYDGEDELEVDREIDFRKIKGMEIESDTDDDEKNQNTCSSLHCNNTLVDGKTVVDEEDELQIEFCSEACLNEYQAIGSQSEEDSSGDETETDEEDEYVLYELQTNGWQGYIRHELNEDILERGWTTDCPSRLSLPTIVDMPTWPNCCKEAQENLTCNCGEFVFEKVVVPSTQVASLLTTRTRKQLRLRLRYKLKEAIKLRSERLELLKALKSGELSASRYEEDRKTAKNFAIKPGKKTTKKRKRQYDICSTLVLNEHQFVQEIPGQRVKRYFCPVCEEDSQRKLNAMQHAMHAHHCTVIREDGTKMVLNTFKCMHEACRNKTGWHHFNKFAKHMAGVHCRDIVESECNPGTYCVEGHESCAAICPLKRGCDRKVCTSYSPCNKCRECYGCSDMGCDCWKARSTCSVLNCKLCAFRERKRSQSVRVFSKCV